MALDDLLRAARGENASPSDYDALAAAIRAAPAEARALLDREGEAATELCYRACVRASDAAHAAIDAALAAGSERVAETCLRLVTGVHLSGFAERLAGLLCSRGYANRVAEVVRRSIGDFMREERARDPFEHTDPWGNPTTTDDLLAYIVRGYIDKLPESARPAALEEARSHPEISDKL